MDTKPITKIASSFILVLFSASIMVSFQNCGGMEAAYNPLYDSPANSGCMGISCEKDLAFVGFKSSSAIILDRPAYTTPPAACDNSTCFDVGGFCETGGFANSVFYYQWTLGGTTLKQPVRTTSTCNENGRFQLQVQVPFSEFDFTKSHQVRVYMNVVDENNVELPSSSPDAAAVFVVTVRN